MIIISCISYVIYNGLNSTNKLLKIEEKFNDIDEKYFSNEISNEAVIMLRDYLAVDELSTGDIKKISRNIKVFEDFYARIIEYSQPPNLHGNSGRSSWKILESNDGQIVIFEKDKPINLIKYKIIETENKPILFAYNENHQVNHRKIQMFSYEITDDGIKERKALSDIDMESNEWEIIEEQGLIWNKNNYSIYVDNIMGNGEITISSINEQGNKQKLILTLNENNQYKNYSLDK
jgi:hypothetical protein